MVAKIGGPDLDIEGRMLEHLGERSDLPVPRVLHAEADVLVMEHIEHAGGSGWGRHLADLLAALHGITSLDGRFGHASPTLIGPIRLENRWASDWGGFYRDARVLPLIEEASRRGNLRTVWSAGCDRTRSASVTIWTTPRRHRSFTAMSGAGTCSRAGRAWSR
ncbi:MAG: fructosamine kinase family protein [Phycisphaerales bacterium]